MIMLRAVSVFCLLMMVLAFVALYGVAASAQEIFRIDSTSTGGLCLKGFVQNEPGKICIKPPGPDGKKIITKPKPATGCVSPWTERGSQCVAVLKVSRVQ